MSSAPAWRSRATASQRISRGWWPIWRAKKRVSSPGRALQSMGAPTPEEWPGGGSVQHAEAADHHFAAAPDPWFLGGAEPQHRWGRRAGRREGRARRGVALGRFLL